MLVARFGRRKTKRRKKSEMPVAFFSWFRNVPDTRLLVTIVFNSCEFPDRVVPRANQSSNRGTDRVIVTGCNPFNDC